MTFDKDYRGFLNEEEELDFHRWLGMNYKQYKEELKQAKEEERKRILEIIDKRYLKDRKLGLGTGLFWEELKQEIKKTEGENDN